MSARRAWGLLALALWGGFYSGCGAPQQSAPSADPERVASRLAEIRPTDGTGHNNNGYGIPAQVYDPPGNHFRVYYVTTSDNAVDLTDEAPKNGVPDFVEAVGAAAEETYQSTIIRRGFRPPLDDSIYHDRPDYGGDGRFDIYLRWAGRGSDGYRVIEACTDGTDGGSPDRCAGYFVMNPSYKDGHYPSELDGIQVLTSHELFHSLQDAYHVGQWRTFSEGSAVWNELQVFPDSPGTFKDYLGFLPAFFREPERPFDKSMGAGGAASYAYATAAWVEFLSERFGPSLIREIWEGCEAPPTGEAPHFLDAADAALRKKYASSLEASWIDFTRWNLLTGERAVTGRGYHRAAEYPVVRMEPELTALGQSATLELNGLSARYLRLRAPVSEPTIVRISISDPGTSTPAAAAALQPSDGPPGDFVEIGAENDVTLLPGSSLLVVLSGAVRGARARNAVVTFSGPIEPPQDAGGCMVGSPGAPTGGLSIYGLYGVAYALMRARRRLRRSCALPE